MTSRLYTAVLAALLVLGPASAAEKKTKARKVETGASCKAPAVGRCAACSITCPVGETASCGGGRAAADLCHTQPVCRCVK